MRDDHAAERSFMMACRVHPAAVLLLAMTLGAISLHGAPIERQRLVESFDAAWKFHQGVLEGGELPAFDDASWSFVDVPHDWSIAGPVREDAPTARGGGFFPSGVAWYRKAFFLPEAMRDRRVFIEFDGVMAHSDVWLNGHHLGHRPGGYVSFRYELTPHLDREPGAANLVAVRADTSAQPASRWYTGAGIHRHVRLVAVAPVHLEAWSTFVSTPEIAPASAVVRVQANMVNTSDAAQDAVMHVTLLDPTGQESGRGTTEAVSLPPGKALPATLDLRITGPRRWDVDRPNLHRAVVQVVAGGLVVDDEVVTFGVRQFAFEPATGFRLNGRLLKIKGVCLHHDGGAFGAAVPLSVWERRLTQMKSIGVNAVRTAHNAVSPEFLDLCDRMGLLVMSEFFDTWRRGKLAHDYHQDFDTWAAIDARDTIRRDRNHPSIIIYSAGNEIRDTRDAASAQATLRKLLEVYRAEDPTRPVSQGLFRPNSTGDYENGLADLLDVVGQNYREAEILAAHAQNPDRRILGTENGHGRSVWVALRDNPAYAGQFIWSGIDYLGESRGWPELATPFGIVDRAGGVRPRTFERASWWGSTPVVHIARRVGESAAQAMDPGYETAVELEDQRRRDLVQFSDWTPANRDPHEEIVEVYSNCETVELVLNGRSLGTLPLPDNAAPRRWIVTFEPGRIEAIGRNDGAVVATHLLRTASVPMGLAVSGDRPRLAPGFDDVAQIEVFVVDGKGERVPDADHRIEFSVSGPGAVVAVDNGDNASHEPFQAAVRSAYQGRCVAWVRALATEGTITITARADGLAPSSVTIEAVVALP